MVIFPGVSERLIGIVIGAILPSGLDVLASYDYSQVAKDPAGFLTGYIIGVRRGSDVFKAMALGANAVCVGRPYLWGLGAFGQPGVERVMELLQTEFKSTMQQMGAANIAAINSAMIYKEGGFS